MLLKEDVDDLRTRIRYLRAHQFSLPQIARIVTKNPLWLTCATKHIDESLGHFQTEFKLLGRQVRKLAAKQPSAKHCAGDRMLKLAKQYVAALFNHSFNQLFLSLMAILIFHTVMPSFYG